MGEKEILIIKWGQCIRKKKENKRCEKKKRDRTING